MSKLKLIVDIGPQWGRTYFTESSIASTAVAHAIDPDNFLPIITKSLVIEYQAARR